MAKNKRPQQKRKTKRRRRISDSQTNQPFERDSKNRIGPYGGAGEPPLMKKKPKPITKTNSKGEKQ